MPSSAKKKNALSLLIGPPTVPPNCSRWKSSSGLPSDSVAGQRLEALEVEEAAVRRRWCPTW